MNRRKLETELNELVEQGGDKGKIKMFVNGELYGEYDLSIENSIDTKTPSAWLRGNLVFMRFKYPKIESVSLKYVEE